MSGVLDDLGTVGGIRVGRVVVGPLAENCYLVAGSGGGDAVLIDPGADADTILDAARGWGLVPRLVVNTHGHVDHIGANREVVEAHGAALAIHPGDAAMLTDPARNLSAFLPPPVVSPAATQLLSDGEELAVGHVRLTVLHTPGHTRGSVCLRLSGTDGTLVFTGDTLFAGSVGRVDLPGGSWPDLMGGIASRLLPLGDAARALPGHGPETTMGREHGSNPFILEWLSESDR